MLKFTVQPDKSEKKPAFFRRFPLFARNRSILKMHVAIIALAVAGGICAAETPNPDLIPNRVPHDKQMTPGLPTALSSGVKSKAPAVAEKINYIANGRLDAAQVAFPPFLTVSGKAEYRRDASPDGAGSILLRGEDNRVVIRQEHSCTLTAGERYRLSAWIRTHDLKAENFRIVMHDNGWNIEMGILEIPVNTHWRRFENTFTAPASQNNDFGFAVLLLGGISGEAEFADIKLEPMSPAAAEGARSLLSSIGDEDRLIPLAPALALIPADNPSVRLRWFGAKECGQFQVHLDGLKMPRVQISDNIVTVNLNGISLGDHRLELTNSKSRFTFNITIVPPFPKVETKRLNNLVRSLPSLTLKDGETGEFEVPSNAWYYLIAPAVNAELLVKGKTMPQIGEGFFRLKAGKHQLTLKGASGVVDIRQTPVIYYYQPLSGPYPHGFARNDTAQMKKYMINAINTFGLGLVDTNASESEIAELQKTGWARWGSMQAYFKTAEEMAKEINDNEFFKRHEFSGVSLDEFSSGRIPQLVQFTKAISLLNVPKSKTLDCWVYGAPLQGAIMTDFISGVINVSHGAGMVIFEAYCTPSRNEETARKYCDSIIIDNTISFKKNYPEILPNLGMVFIHCNVPNSLTAAIYPEIDLKYYLDLQFQTAATATELDGLGMIGTWGGNYADNEMARWTAALCRHYAVEGKTSLLSEKYGYKFIPGFLQNGDFEKGLKHWQVDGNITIGKHDWYGRKIQRRWTAPKGIGDNYCIMSRGKSPNIISQKLQGLEPGKIYKLQYLTSDAVDVTASGKGKPQEIRVTATLDGCEILDKYTIYNRAGTSGKYHRTNCSQLVFKAISSEPLLRFSDADNALGRKAALNYVSVMPYFIE